MTASSARCTQIICLVSVAVIAAWMTGGWGSPAAYAQSASQGAAQASKSTIAAAGSDAAATGSSDPVVPAHAPGRLAALRTRIGTAVTRRLHAVKAAAERLHPVKAIEKDLLFRRASRAFPTFCKDWGSKLHNREVNNLEHVAWHEQHGWETGTYVAYSAIKTCNTKRSTGGTPIGELTYQEHKYYLAGHTVEQARHAEPKLVSITNTTEIFRWDKTKWVY